MDQLPPPVISAEDVENSYRLCLGRRPESPEAIESKRRHQPADLLGELLDSDEFRDEVLAPILTGADLAPGRFAGKANAGHIAWLTGLCELGPESRQRLEAVHDWPWLLAIVLEDGGFREWVNSQAPDWRSDEAAAALERWADAGVGSVIGGVDLVEAAQVKGWALDLAEVDEPLSLEIYADGMFLGACSTGQFRRDLQERYGGDGMFGFSAKVDLPARVLSRRSVRVTVEEARTSRLVCSADVTIDPQVKLDALAVIRTELARVHETLSRIEAQLPDIRTLTSFSLETYPEYRRSFYQEIPAERTAWKQAVSRLAWTPRFSLLVPVSGSDIALLEEMISSVFRQDYPHWELILSDDGSTNRVEVAALVDRVQRQIEGRFSLRLIRSEEPTSIADCTNRALAAVEGDYIAFMDAGDLLAPEALACVALALQREPRPRILYSDEDRVWSSPEGREQFESPRFKPEFDAVLLMQVNYIQRLLVLEAGLCREAGPLDPAYDGAQEHDLLLRAVEIAGAESVHHIPRVLYHGRSDQPSPSADPARAVAIQERTESLTTEHLRRTGRTGEVGPHQDEVGGSQASAVRLHPPNLSDVRATVVIPTRDQLHLLRPCVESLLAKRPYNRSQFELVLVDNGSTDEACLAYLGSFARQAGVRVVRDSSRFNWAALNNAAVRDSASDVLIFLNNDTAALSPHWCDELCYWALQPEVGAVGARLLYADGTIQHAGAVLGAGGMLHEGVGIPASEGGYLGRHQLVHRVSAVTGACLATRRVVFEELGGFDASRFAITFNDTDYCLRLDERGLWVIYTPHATFYHYESKTRGFDSGSSPAEQVREAATFRRLWGGKLETDPFYNPHFERHAAPFTRLAPPYALRSTVDVR